MNRKDEKGLQFSVSFEGSPNERIPVAAHVFDRAGNHIESSEIDEKGQFRLSLSAKELQQAKLFIAPRNDDRKIPTLNDLEKISAYQPFLDRRAIGRDIIELYPIPELKYKYWWRCSCRVTGRVTKKVFIGGAWHTMPVCKAKVHICEVDRWPILIQKFPDDIIRKIKDEIIKIKWPIPPIPDPGPLRNPAIPFNVGDIKIKAVRANTAIRKVEAAEPAAASEQFSFGINSLKAQLLSVNSAYHIRQELSESFQLIYPYFCYWPWIWRYFTSCDEKAVVLTDGQGRFDAIVKYNCFGDRPDIYTWVEYFIDGQWVTVHNPGRACHTLWNYTCSTDININITDSRVPFCRPDLPGAVCEIMSIGNAAFTSHILQRNVVQTVQGVSFNAKGLTDIYLAGLPGIRYVNPFGGNLDVVADFGSTLHSSGVTHYRCSYKKNADADIYTWVEYFIDGQWVTVHNPGRACHTLWNYTCSTDININITDSRVPFCRPDLPGAVCEIMSIGNAAFTSHILQRNVVQTVQGVSFNAKGLTDIYLAGLPGIRYVNPFGGNLDVVADFGSTLHSSGVTHYRCSYKKNADADIPSSWTIFNDPLSREYEDEINDGMNPVFQQRKSFDLKDPSFSGLYIIPYHDAATQPGIPVPAGTLINREWMTQAFTVASIVSTDLQDGMYDFRFELYRINAGTPERVSVPRSTFHVSNPDDTRISLPLSNTAFSSADYPAFHVEDYLVNDPGNALNALAYKMSFRVNNDSCNAVIDNITVLNTDGSTADSDTECGFAPYADKATSKVEFSFEASHPENFAVFGFSVIRGNAIPCPDANTDGMVIGNSSNGYTLAGGRYSKEVPVASLLGNCEQAAFSENLHVYALATNGYRRLYEYDRPWVAAFAIEPATEAVEA